MTKPIVNPTFAVDAALAAGLGVALVALADVAHSLAGGGLSPLAIRLVGAALLPWAWHNWRTAKEQPLSTTSFAIHAAVDSLWVLASLELLVVNHATFTPIGWLLYGPQTVLVGVVLLGKLSHYRQARAATA